jgi:hypothetical protein
MGIKKNEKEDFSGTSVRIRSSIPARIVLEKQLTKFGDCMLPTVTLQLFGVFRSTVILSLITFLSAHSVPRPVDLILHDKDYESVFQACHLEQQKHHEKSGFLITIGKNVIESEK